MIVEWARGELVISKWVARVSVMDLEQFVDEANRLARKATILKCEGSGNPVGYWHGEQGDEPWISVFDDGRWVSVYLEGISKGYTVRTQEPVKSSRPLYAETMASLPPVDAVFLLGSSQIESYLNRHRWEREYGFNNNFPDSIPFEYERLYQKNCPIFLQGIAAVCGGWHFPWPDGDFEKLIDARLVVWTLLESEPWIEVFEEDGCFTVKQRIT